MTSIAPSFSRGSHYWWLQRSKIFVRLSPIFFIFLLVVSSKMNEFQINFFLIFHSPDFWFPDFFFSGSFFRISWSHRYTHEKLCFLSYYWLYVTISCILSYFFPGFLITPLCPWKVVIFTLLLTVRYYQLHSVIFFPRIIYIYWLEYCGCVQIFLHR